ncbi:diguanylate cyclase [Marinomonas ushuaiensis DSM 15871]|uniref:Diguanylate cyclase n=1 Tax=Marinomonas ushuaiensis DSM 15871 TaxID=1122207 RepID=X7E4Z9_9GAMM|nr:DinB family protein [Marinomonas ushuaiensis]ETX11144.1 diguanylate cyclase [Marinomonas ushuaiensis DSM 15871]
MSLKSHFTLMAEYNQIMNRNLYDAASKLSVVELTTDQGAFFGSIINTLNHILVGDIIWLKRFASHPFVSLEYVRALPQPTALNTVLYADLEILKQHREILDNVIVQFASELNDEVLIQPLIYQNTKGIEHQKNCAHLLQHFFNHQTHHRGQVSTLLSQQGIDIGATDLVLLIPDLD